MGSLIQKSRSKVLKCSFCGKTQNEVRKLIAGPKVYICDECVDLCIDILAADFSKKHQGCLLCGLTKEMQEMTRITRRGSICSNCLAEVGAIIEHLNECKPRQTT